MLKIIWNNGKQARSNCNIEFSRTISNLKRNGYSISASNHEMNFLFTFVANYNEHFPQTKSPTSL